MPKISVIMPIYNTNPQHLQQAIQSILSQTFSDFEFIILNDSPENTSLVKIIQEYNDPRIIYLENSSHQGIAGSYNILLQRAQGKYIAMMNHDDIALPQRLQTQLDYLESHPQTVLVGSAYKKFGEINRFKTITPPSSDAQIRALMLFKSPIHHPTIMFRNHTAKSHNVRYNENYISLNDRLFYYDMSKHGRLANLPNILYKYRFHKDMTSKRQKIKIQKERAAFHKLWFAYNNIDLTPEEVEIFDNYTTYGRCKIKNFSTIKIACETLEKLVQLNQHKHFVPEEEDFANVCATYYMKRCLNALYNGKINIKHLLRNTKLNLPKKQRLFLYNALLGWRN